MLEVGFNLESGPALNLAVDFADIGSHNPEAEHLYPAQKPDGADDGRPAFHGMACYIGYQGIKQAENAEQGYDDAQA